MKRIFKAMGAGPMLLVPTATLTVFFATGSSYALLPRIATGFVWVHASLCVAGILLITAVYCGCRDVFERAAHCAAGRMPSAWKTCLWHGVLVPMLWASGEHASAGMLVATFIAAMFSRSLIQKEG